MVQPGRTARGPAEAGCYEVRLKPDATRFGWRRTPRIPTNSELHGSR